MTLEKMLYIAKNKLGIIIMIGLLVSAVAFLFLVVTQKNFKVTTQLLVVQNQQGFSDYYALSKSADYLTNVLSEAIYSERFLSEVDATGIAATNTFLPADKVLRLKRWEKTVRVSKDPAIGTMTVEVFSDNQKQAIEISQAVANVLTAKSFSFLGKGQDVEVRILNGPLWEKNPTVAEIGFAVVSGFFAGAFLAFLKIYYQEEKRWSRLRKTDTDPDDYQKSLENL